jgi:hypothetical protein
MSDLAIVTLKPPQGRDAPTDLFFPSGRRAQPDAKGQVTVGGLAAVALIQAGWQVVVPESIPFATERQSS